MDWSLLREVSSRLPNLATLAISTKIRLTAIPHDISKFTNVVELWYHEQPYCSPGEEESENCNDYVPLFIRIILPALPKLQRLCITVDLDDSSVPAFKLPSAAILSSSRSLSSLTIQFVREATGDYRFDTYRDDLESDWVSNILEGAEYIRHFSF
ncbi:hypothetical protein FS842_008683 [Serendipita sp. 407]|nr:hypothetical protein FS842_008683 [Serendipita sp. 407]